uniref:hypothetical protein n=1 Tax=Hydrocytium acuminatum TaxID=1745963 RepID=UPI002A83E508|nr:hypothetical protein UYM18_pgp109 [Hydrocytium acuminatum]WOR09511.1 hypothetical protein [Hydrocytium acuminatum]
MPQQSIQNPQKRVRPTDLMHTRWFTMVTFCKLSTSEDLYPMRIDLLYSSYLDFMSKFPNVPVFPPSVLITALRVVFCLYGKELLILNSSEGHREIILHNSPIVL